MLTLCNTTFTTPQMYYGIQSNYISGSILICSEFSVGKPWQQMSHRRHEAAWHSGIIGVWPQNDSAHQTRTPLPFSARKGRDKMFLISFWCRTETFGSLRGILLHCRETLLHTAFIDAARPEHRVASIWFCSRFERSLTLQHLQVVFHLFHFGRGSTQLAK